MRTEDFHAWLSRASELTPSQRQQAIDHLSQKQEPDEVIGAIVGPNPPCPHGHHAPCRCWGNAHGRAAPVSLRRLRQDVQCAHQAPPGPVAAPGILAGVCTVNDRW